MDGFDLTSAVDELYSGDPADFVATRKTLVSRLREQGDRDIAKTVGALRRPTAVAAAVNALARRHEPPALPELEDLGARMRAAQAEMDTTALKELSGERTRLIASLTKDAESLGITTAGAKEQLTQTFTAALASQDAQDVVSSGQLVNPLSYSGFGEVEVSEAAALPLRDLQEARLAELAQREAERSKKPTRSAERDEPGREEAEQKPPAKKQQFEQKKPKPEAKPGPASKRAEPKSAEAKPQKAKTAEPKTAQDSEATEKASPAAESGGASTSADPTTVRAVYEVSLAVEQQALAAVDAARAALTAAKEHAASATKARQAAEDLLDSLD
ncbi:hypothetical protein IEE94_07710 [Yimella sp. cx-573]|nr:hypothetical protein [Yimella sp. cx-573]